MKQLYALLFLVTLVSVSACDKVQQASNINQEAKANDASDIALGHYITAHNKFISDRPIDPEGMNDGSLEGAMAQYQYNAEKFSAEDEPQFNIISFNYFELGVDALGVGVKTMQGKPLRPVDKAAAALLPKAKALQAKSTELKAYYDSKKFLDDNFAKAKAEHPAFLSLWKETVALNQALSLEIGQANDQRDLERAKQLKADGELLAYNSMMAMTESKNLLRMLDSGELSSELFAKADIKVAEIESILTAYKAEEKKAEKAGKLDNHFHGKLQAELNKMLGEYREAKNSTDPEARNSAMQKMIKAYNEAVFYSNML